MHRLPPPDAEPSWRWSDLWPDVREAIRGSRRDFTQGSLGRAILLLAIPMVLETSMHSIFAVCDMYFVARLGSAAVASVGMTEALLSIIFAVGLGLSMGTMATVARRIGEKNLDGAAQVTVQAIGLGVLISGLIGAFGVWQAENLLRMMGAQPDVLETGVGYARHIFGGSGTIVLLFLINAVFRGAGDPMLALRALAFANLANILLDPVLIFGFGPVPAMGVTGAAVATNIGRGLGVLYQLHLLHSSGRVRIEGRHLGLRPDIMTRLVRVSGVATFQFFIATTSFTGLVKVISPYSSEALAGYTIAIRVIIFVLLPAWGMSNAAATLVGQNLGAHKPERAERAAWVTARYNMWFLGTVSILFIAAARPIIGFFTDVPGVVEYGAQCLRIVSFGYVLMAYGMVLTASFNGAGDTTTPTWVNLFCHWFLKIPLAWILTWPLGWGPTGMFVAIPITEVAVAVTAIILFRRGRWRHKMV